MILGIEQIVAILNKSSEQEIKKNLISENKVPRTEFIFKTITSPSGKKADFYIPVTEYDPKTKKGTAAFIPFSLGITSPEDIKESTNRMMRNQLGFQTSEKGERMQQDSLYVLINNKGERITVKGQDGIIGDLLYGPNHKNPDTLYFTIETAWDSFGTIPLERLFSKSKKDGKGQIYYELDNAVIDSLGKHIDLIYKRLEAIDSTNKAREIADRVHNQTLKNHEQRISIIENRQKEKTKKPKYIVDIGAVVANPASWGGSIGVAKYIDCSMENSLGINAGLLFSQPQYSVDSNSNFIPGIGGGATIKDISRLLVDLYVEAEFGHKLGKTADFSIGTGARFRNTKENIQATPVIYDGDGNSNVPIKPPQQTENNFAIHPVFSWGVGKKIGPLKLSAGAKYVPKQNPIHYIRFSTSIK